MKSSLPRRLLLLSPPLILAAWVAAAGQEPEPAPRWFKGNTHTHTLWSDGDGAPQLVADLYREAGYDFLVLSDHNVLSEGQRWFPVEAEGRLTPERLADLSERFGKGSVETRDREGGTEMRLQTLAELRERFGDELLLIQGEEITGAQVHVNGLGIESLVMPVEGDSPAQAIERAFAAVRAQGEALGRPVLAHVNHPNFNWAVKPTDLTGVEGRVHFEVYNGHPAVQNPGDGDHASTEELWDMALTLRLGAFGRGPVYGLATDDTHHVHARGPELSNAFRGWVMVRAREASRDAILAALARGDFYATTGVELDEVAFADGTLSVAVRRAQGVTYRTEFIGTRSTDAGLGEVGELLLSTADNPARYTLEGDELYVRARVISDRRSPEAAQDDGPETAWVQPVVPEGR